jgi:hypothetical protein
MRCVISLSASLATLAALALMGCGRNATREDCELIVNRNVEVQLKAMGVSDEPTVQKRTGELRTQMKSDIDECVGKRITDGMIACVKGADSAEAITKCMR